MEGLIDMYQYAGNKQALDVVVKMGDWAYHKLENLSPEQLAIMHKNRVWGHDGSSLQFICNYRKCK